MMEIGLRGFGELIHKCTVLFFAFFRGDFEIYIYVHATAAVNICIELSSSPLLWAKN